jgi:hypothetical protein
MRDPSGLKAAELIKPSSPCITPTSVAVATSQIRAVLSPDTVTTRDPSGLKAAEKTGAGPRNMAIATPVCEFQIRAV